ncbi:MAG TPA: DNA-formamidopyrimidine glycosylase family protein [Thermoanaerobaculia bacterium]|nr:DNA-formamidopyrimidine glycosylase family protein [Thermoanaerobaculia bacterium]
MPEGDTIFRAARTLNEALAGRTVTNFETVFPRLSRVDDEKPITGRRIERVFAAGKHLIIDFSGGLHLRTHMRMNGSWHIYRRGERWQRSRADMRIVIGTDHWVAVGFNVPVAEFHDDRGLRKQADLRAIGPDMAAPSFDEEEAVRRIRDRSDSEIADVLLNQRVVGGLGNVFKSEVLFVCRVNPFAPVGELEAETVREIVRTARALVLLNVASGAAPGRGTRGSLDREQRLWVYARGGEPCRRCGTPIEYRKQGLDARGTYWCAKCQERVG